MQEKIIEELRKELKDQIEENKELNDSITWWKNRYEAQVKINEEHQKINGELRKEIERLNNIIKEVREYIQDRYDGEVLTHTFDKDNVGELLEILERVNK